MKASKNKYSMTFYFKDERIMFLEYVNDTNKAIKWLEQKGKEWTHCMIYDRKTRVKIERKINTKYAV